MNTRNKIQAKKGYTLVELLAIPSLLIAATCFAAWVQHIVTTINEELWVLLVVGAFFFPVGVIHGFLVWLGAV